MNIPQNFPVKAMVMAAGLGTRMRPLTNAIPKPLVKVAGKPLIDYTLDFLASSGIEEAVVNSHYLAEMLEAHVLARKYPPRIKISREIEVLETGGGIKKALNMFGHEAFFVLNSDVICIDGKTPALHRLWQYWDEANMDALLLLNKVETAIGYSGQGDFFLEDGKLIRRAESETAPYVFTGIQLISPRLFNNSPDGKFSLNLLYNRDLSRIGAVVHDGNWLHIGSPSELSEAENWLKNQPKETQEIFPPPS
jgi:MurNAc alpha-1-phosphate uridylyltransferase